MPKKRKGRGPSLNGDPGTLSRDLAIEREQPSLDLVPPSYVRKAWEDEDKKKCRKQR